MILKLVDEVWPQTQIFFLIKNIFDYIKIYYIIKNSVTIYVIKLNNKNKIF